MKRINRELHEANTGIDKLIADVEEATDYNDHTGAILLVAQYLKLPKYIKILEAISVIHHQEGSMPYLLNQYRDTISKEIRLIVRNKLDPADAQRVMGLL